MSPEDAKQPAANYL